MAYQKVLSVVKAMKILECLREKTLRNEYLTLSEAAEAAEISHVSAYNLLKTLEECGYIRHSARGKYEEGAKNGALSAGPNLSHRLCELAHPILERAASGGNESFVLVTLSNARRVELLRIGKIKNSHHARFEANAQLYAMRTTRAILAWYSPVQLEYFVRRNGLPDEAAWPECKQSRTGLRHELDKIRGNGGCCDIHGQLTATAVPVFDDNGEVIASLGCYSPVVSTDYFRQQGIFKFLHDSALLIQDEL